jgi:predicted Zn-dependent peptidase
MLQRARFAHGTGLPHAFQMQLGTAAQLDLPTMLQFAETWISVEGMAAVWGPPGGGGPSRTARTIRPALAVLPDAGWADAPWPRVVARELPNGLDVAAVEIGAVPWATQQLSMRGGWADEPESGIVESIQTSLVEYERVFRRGELKERVGLSHFGFDSAYADYLYARALPHNTDLALWAFRDRLASAQLDTGYRQSELDRELVRSRLSFTAAPWRLADGMRQRAILGDGPAGSSWWDRNRAARFIKLNTMSSWMRETRRPSRSALALASDMPAEKSLFLAEKYMKSWKGTGKMQGIGRVLLPEPTPRTVYSFDFDAPYARVKLACRLQGATPETAPALNVLDSTLAFLVRRTLADAGITTHAGAAVEMLRSDASYLTVSASVAPEDTANVLGLFRSVVNASRKLPENLVRARAESVARIHALGATHPAGATDLLGWLSARGYRGDSFTTWKHALAEVTPRDIAALLGPCLKHDVTTIIGRDVSGVLDGADIEHEPVDWLNKGRALYESFEVR